MVEILIFPCFSSPQLPCSPPVLEGVTPALSPHASPRVGPCPFGDGASPKDKNYQNLFYFYPHFSVTAATQRHLCILVSFLLDLIHTNTRSWLILVL